MEKPRCGRGLRGFSLIEMLVVLALLITLMLIGVPALQTSMRQNKLRGIANDTATLMRLARLDAIRRSCTSVVRIVETPPSVEGFPDCDLNGIADPDKPALGSFPVPRGVYHLAPPNLLGKPSVLGLSASPIPGDPNRAVFQPDGSIQAIGGFHFGDDLGNFLEVWVSPAATARIEVLKCRTCLDANNRADWYASGDGGAAWTWK
jgi:prepilin-type N-terminal cleavage/methylation domain-containing protein